MNRHDPHGVKPETTLFPTRQFVGGGYVEGAGETIEIENPATEEIIARLRAASVEQVDLAIAEARAAFRSGVWRDPAFRRTVLLKMADLLEERQADFISVLVQEVGTPVALCAPIHIGGPLSMLRSFADLTVKDRTRRLGPDGRTPPSESIVRYEPIGVVAAIGAYNYPLTMMVAKACAALAAGCACVFMSGPLTPLACLKFGEIARDAGLPPGILNIITGGPEIGAALTGHPGIGKVSFTGSVPVGRKVMMQAAQNLAGVVLELGGKSAGIVLPGADLAAVALPLHSRYLRNAGQGCQSPTRLLVPAKDYDDFIAASREAFANIQFGDPWDPKTLAGPLITEAHRARVEGYVERAVRDGGQILIGGGRPQDQPRGWFMNPTLIGGLDNDSELARNELFGPVAMVMPYKDVEEAIALANDSDLGLAASVFGPLEDAKAVAERLEAGSVFINGGGQLRVDAVLTGWKHSGIGKEWGEDGISEFLEAKHIQWAL